MAVLALVHFDPAKEKHLGMHLREIGIHWLSRQPRVWGTSVKCSLSKAAMRTREAFSPSV